MAKQEQEHEKQEINEAADAVTEELEKLKEQVGEFENKYKRALADYQNLEKRVADQRSEWAQSASKELILRMLPVLDTLYMASTHLKDQGLTITIQQFLDALRAEGVTRIETKDKPFDPYLMEAIATGEGPDGKVIEELRAGYLLYEKVLRPAQVKVGKKNE